MKRTYTLQDLLWRKMFDYGFRSVREMAEAVGVHYCNIWYVMSDRRYKPGLDVRRKLCAALDIAPEVLDEAVVNGWTPGTEE